MIYRKNKNIVYQHFYRAMSSDYARNFEKSQRITGNLIARIGLEYELEGHAGCVNCLEWNESGTLLASGSDDLNVILWDPFRHRKLHSFQTAHDGNIFSVKILPNTQDKTFVTCAADCKICVYDLGIQDSIQICRCHSNRVKRLATAPHLPYLFWSAGEDGKILQFDMRTKHTCSPECSNILINLHNYAGKNSECKCLTINPFRPELLAVGANDPYVRLYDMRMIRTISIKDSKNALQKSDDCSNLPENCVQYFVAGIFMLYTVGFHKLNKGHLPLKHIEYRRKFRNLAATYVTFGPDGNTLLVNLGGEQIYLFDINDCQRPQAFDIPVTFVNGLSTGTSKFVNTISEELSQQTKKVAKYPSPVEELKSQANANFSKQNFTLAVSLYNEAINLLPNAAILYSNRAAALMKRGWDGDIYSAMRDCIRALQLDSSYFKAHFRLARCLYELHWTKEASDCLQAFIKKFPSQINCRAFQALEKDIHSAILQKSADSESEDDAETHSGANNIDICEISKQEKLWRAQAADYHLRYWGHCNTTTDIKEANFLGKNFIVAGSDDGSFFIWNVRTTNIVRILRGDDSIVNCLQPHPSSCLLATSGIDSVVRLWSPLPEDGRSNDREITDQDDVASANQKRMNSDPVEVMLMNMGYRVTTLPNNMDDSFPPLQCRTN